ncbi:hypothetical protein AOLI_G00018050 [Acnodon oligacanthus]
MSLGPAAPGESYADLNKLLNRARVDPALGCCAVYRQTDSSRHRRVTFSSRCAVRGGQTVTRPKRVDLTRVKNGEGVREREREREGESRCLPSTRAVLVSPPVLAARCSRVDRVAIHGSGGEETLKQLSGKAFSSL